MNSMNSVNIFRLLKLQNTILRFSGAFSIEDKRNDYNKVHFCTIWPKIFHNINFYKIYTENVISKCVCFMCLITMVQFNIAVDNYAEPYARSSALVLEKVISRTDVHHAEQLNLLLLLSSIINYQLKLQMLYACLTVTNFVIQCCKRFKLMQILWILLIRQDLCKLILCHLYQVIFVTPQQMFVLLVYCKRLSLWEELLKGKLEHSVLFECLTEREQL